MNTIDKVINTANLSSATYELTQDISHLNNAITILERALPSSGSQKAQCLNSLGDALFRRFQVTGTAEDIKRANKIFAELLDAWNSMDKQGMNEEALKSTKALFLCNLGASCMELSSFQRGDEGSEKAIQYLKTAIECFKEGIDLESIGSFLPVRLSNLGTAYMRLYQSGDTDVKSLDNAIDLFEKARRHPALKKSELPTFLTNLGGALYVRYEATERLETLNSAIQVANEAIQLTPFNHYDMAGRMHNLANMMESRYLRLNQQFDLWAAVRFAEIAVRITQGNTHDQAKHVDALAMKREKWRSRANHGGGENESSHVQRIFDDFPLSKSDDPDNARRLQNLGELYAISYTETRQQKDLDMAIELAERSVNATDVNSLSRAQRLRNLGRKQLLSDNASIREKAIDTYTESWKCPNGIPWQRLESAIEVVDLRIAQGGKHNLQEAKEIAVGAIQLLPLLSRRDLSEVDRLHILPRFAGLAAKASSLILATSEKIEDVTGAIKYALEILEFGRGSTLGILIDQRQDLADLKRLHPQLAEEYERLLAAINKGDIELSRASLSDSSSLDPRYEASGKLDACIDSVRAKPKFDNFQRPAKAEELSKEGQDGAIIIVNVSSVLSSAIIIENDRIDYLCLPEFSLARLKDYKLDEIFDFKRHNQSELNGRFVKFLKWLWWACVQPIFDRMGYLKDGPVDFRAIPTKRVWWVGVGSAANIPFHAAGQFSQGRCRENTLHYVISSYSPTVKALAFARKKFSQADKSMAERKKICLVTMPETPGHDRLNDLARQVESIEKAVGNSFTINEFTSPNADTVKKAIPVSDVLHFAGHGSVDPHVPFKSSLVLQKSKMHKTEIKAQSNSVSGGAPRREAVRETEQAKQETKQEPRQELKQGLKQGIKQGTKQEPRADVESQLAKATDLTEQIKAELEFLTTHLESKRRSSDLPVEAGIRPAESSSYEAEAEVEVEVDHLYVSEILDMKLKRASLAYLSACSTAECRSSDVLVDEVIHPVSSFQVAGYANVVGTLWKADSRYSSKLVEEFYALLSKNGAAALLTSSSTSSSSSSSLSSPSLAASAGSDRGERDGGSGGGVARVLHAAIVNTMTRPSDVLTWALYAHFGV